MIDEVPTTVKNYQGFSVTTLPAAMAGHGSRHIVLFSLPFQGHLNPMLKLAAVLHARGLGVTVLHTDFNAPDPARHPELTFVPIHEMLGDEATSPDSDILAKLLALNTACKAPFREALASLLRGGRNVSCAVVDGQCYAALGAAGQLGVPVLALRTDSAAVLRNMLAYPRLRDAGYLPIKGKQKEQLDEVVPELEPLRVRDLIRVDGCDTDEMCGFVARVADAVGALVSGVVFNTLEAMEASELVKIQRELSLPAFAIGPLHLLSSSQDSAEQSLYTPDVSCLAWLDAHPARSVLYVSLGSLACVDRGVFEEMAWGLAASGVPFLWVVRPGLVTGAGASKEVVPLSPDGFCEEIGNRGKIVTWAPQREVLAHAAIGAYCGWNSIMESVCEGVPMLAQPCFADQIVNARYVTHQWGIGLEVGEKVQRETVAKVAARVMVGEDGPLMREKALCLQMQASAATSSAMDGLVRYVLSL